MNKIIGLILNLSVALYFGSAVFAEHPGEHSETTHKREHPGEKAVLSSRDIIKGIKNHISEVTRENSGYYPIRDEKEMLDLRLKLIKVHEDRVSYIKKEKAYFACTDFMAQDGITVYDVDFWMANDSQGNLSVYQEKIHKKNGVPRFSYKDDEIVPIEEAQMAGEAHS